MKLILILTIIFSSFLTAFSALAYQPTRQGIGFGAMTPYAGARAPLPHSNLKAQGYARGYVKTGRVLDAGEDVMARQRGGFKAGKVYDARGAAHVDEALRMRRAK